MITARQAKLRKFFKNALHKHYQHEYQVQMEQYLESFKQDNPNNPDQIEERLKEFYPEMKRLFKILEKVL